MKVYTMTYRTHNLYGESHGVSRLRVNLTSGSDGEGLETGQVVPRQSFTRQVFFRDCKQFLGLGQSRSTCFDTHIADTTISLVQYTILSFHKRICCSNTFDGIFESVMADIAEYNLAEKLQKIFWLIVETMSEFTGIDVMELTEDIFRDTNAREKLKQLNIFLPKEQLFEHAA